jgi:hypothetical protein
MNRRSVFGVMLMAASLVSAQAVYAAPTTIHTPVNAIFAKVKLVKFTLRNDTAAPLKLKAGDNEMTLMPGKTLDLKLASGQQIVAVEASASYAAGAVITTVSDQLDGSTLALR